MSDKGKGIVTLIVCFVAAIAIVIGELLWNHHYHESGLFVGFAVGIGGTVVAYPVGEWVIRQIKTKVPPPK